MKPHVVDVTQDDFESVVLQGSQQTPVMVDFWADWCAPCKQLAPVLESLAEEYQGAFVLAKVDTETNQMLSAQVGVRSLPTVLLVKEGQVVDHFMGALPEGEIREFLNKHIEAPAVDGMTLANELMSEGDLEGAVEAFKALVEADPDNHDAYLGLAEALEQQGQFDDALAIVTRLPEEFSDNPVVQRLNAQAQLQDLVEDAPSLSECEIRFEQNPDDPETQYFLAARRAQAGQLDLAIEQLIELVRHHRDYRDDGARLLLLKLFELLGKEHPAVRAGRRRLATVLN